MKPRQSKRPPASRSARLVSPELESRSSQFYRLSPDETAITCLACGWTSRHQDHVRMKFCPRCQVFHEDRVLMMRLMEGYETTFESRVDEQRRVWFSE